MTPLNEKVFVKGTLEPSKYHSAVIMLTCIALQGGESRFDSLVRMIISQGTPEQIAHGYIRAALSKGYIQEKKPIAP